MKRFTLTLPAGLLLACLFVAFAPIAGAHADATTGTISGVVVNATHQNVAVANQKVILRRSANDMAQDIAMTTSDNAGRFAIANLPADTSDVYAVYTQFQGGMFSSQAVKLTDATAGALRLSVYDTTNDDANLRVTVATLLVRDPRPINGLISMGEIVSIENTGTTAFVGTPTGDASKPMRLLRFATPTNASNLSLGIGFSGSQIITTDKGFGATATVPPGAMEFAFAIDIPYTGTSADVSYKAVYSTTRVIVLVPPDMFVNGQDFAAQGTIDSAGSRYQLFTVANTAAGKQMTLQVTDLPRAGEQSFLDARALAILAAILALLALLALAFYLRRGNIAAALRLIPAQEADVVSYAPTVATEGADSAARTRLLHELLALERAHSTGAVAAAEYRRQDRELRRQLREILASEQDNVPSPRADSAGGALHGATAMPSVLDDTGAAENAVVDDTATHHATSEQSSGGRR